MSVMINRKYIEKSVKYIEKMCLRRCMDKHIDDSLVDTLKSIIPYYITARNTIYYKFIFRYLIK